MEPSSISISPLLAACGSRSCFWLLLPFGFSVGKGDGDDHGDGELPHGLIKAFTN